MRVPRSVDALADSRAAGVGKANRFHDEADVVIGEVFGFERLVDH